MQVYIQVTSSVNNCIGTTLRFCVWTVDYVPSKRVFIAVYFMCLSVCLSDQLRKKKACIWKIYHRQTRIHILQKRKWAVEEATSALCCNLGCQSACSDAAGRPASADRLVAKDNKLQKVKLQDLFCTRLVAVWDCGDSELPVTINWRPQEDPTG